MQVTQSRKECIVQNLKSTEAKNKWNAATAMDCGADEWGVTANDSIIVVAVEVHLVGPTSGHRPAVGPTILKYCFNSVPSQTVQKLVYE